MGRLETLLPYTSLQFNKLTLFYPITRLAGRALNFTIMAPKTLLPIAALATAALAQSSGGCSGQPTLKSGIQNIDGRQYTLKIPDNYDSSNPYRLIFGFHWRGGSMGDVVNGNSVPKWYGLDALSEGSAIFVAPNGIDNGWANGGGSDIAFVDSIIKQVEADLCVDQSQRFATGFSYGGGMSYSIACSRAGEFRAVAPIAGGLISGCDGGNDPIAYLGIHGVSDNVLPIDMGKSLTETFVKTNGCQAKEIAQPSPGSGQKVRTDFEGCSNPVSFIAWDGGHVGAPAGDFAPQATWEFFTSLASSGASVSGGAPANSTAAAAPVSSQAPTTSEASTEEAPASGSAQAPAASSSAEASTGSAPASGSAEASDSNGCSVVYTDGSSASGNAQAAPTTGNAQNAPAGNAQAPPAGNSWGPPAGNPWGSWGKPGGQWKRFSA
jgi:poly(3-hydroxybutyrate) depolymerase